MRFCRDTSLLQRIRAEISYRFHEKLDDFKGLPALIENAKAAIGVLKHSRTFSKDFFRVGVSGPDRPHLIMVDLPRLIHSLAKL